MQRAHRGRNAVESLHEAESRLEPLGAQRTDQTDAVLRHRKVDRGHAANRCDHVRMHGRAIAVSARIPDVVARVDPCGVGGPEAVPAATCAHLLELL
eukprot:4401853-Prymnesium_polylepis.1